MDMGNKMSIKLQDIILRKRGGEIVHEIDELYVHRPKIQPIMILDTPSLKLMYFYNSMNEKSSENLYNDLCRFYHHFGIYSDIEPYYQYDNTWELTHDNSERDIKEIIKIITNSNYIIILYESDEMLVPLVRRYLDYSTLSGNSFEYEIQRFNRYMIMSYSPVNIDTITKTSYLIRMPDYDKNYDWYLFNSIEELNDGVYKWLKSNCYLPNVRELYNIRLSLGKCESLVETRNNIEPDRLLFTFLLHHIENGVLKSFELRNDIPYPKYIIASNIGWYKVLTSFNELLDYLKKYDGILYDVLGEDATILEINHNTRKLTNMFNDLKFIQRIVANEKLELTDYNLV